MHLEICTRFSSKSIQSMPSPDFIFPPNLMGPFSLVQSRPLDLEIGEKVLKGCPKLHAFGGKINSGEGIDWIDFVDNLVY